MLDIIHAIPPGFLETSAAELHRILERPTLIHLPGRRSTPLFVSILLHGNEDVGLHAIQQLLLAYRGRTLPRALSIFVGNVAAAKEGVRRLPQQLDYNRAWPGGDYGNTPEHAMLSRVVEEMRQRQVFASVDLHSNTGLNPHYACVNRLEHAFLHLATLFSRTVVYFTRPTGVQSMAFAPLCPAVTVECGRVGDTRGIEHARAYVEACLNLSALPEYPVACHDLDLFHTVATVKIPADVSFGCGNPQAELNLRADLERLNFRELAEGTLFAHVNRDKGILLQVKNEAGDEKGDDFFTRGAGEIILRRPVMPAMLTCDEKVIRQDCLCYFMERYPLPS
ncbi:MAG TPA: peptidase M14 [Gammaproteobacteria bacterium]|nr:peptidase M14 [Gammaproteobacteria bacterium]